MIRKFYERCVVCEYNMSNTEACDVNSRLRSVAVD